MKDEQGFFLLGIAGVGIVKVFYPPLSAAHIFALMLGMGLLFWVSNTIEESDRKERERNRAWRP